MKILIFLLLLVCVDIVLRVDSTHSRHQDSPERRNTPLRGDNSRISSTTSHPESERKTNPKRKRDISTSSSDKEHKRRTYTPLRSKDSTRSTPHSRAYSRDDFKQKWDDIPATDRERRSRIRTSSAAEGSSRNTRYSRADSRDNFTRKRDDIPASNREHSRRTHTASRSEHFFRNPPYSRSGSRDDWKRERDDVPASEEDVLTVTQFADISRMKDNKITGMEIDFKWQTDQSWQAESFTNGQHRILQRINMFEFCENVRILSEGKYVYNIHPSVNGYFVVKERYHLYSSSVPLPMRSCRLLRTTTDDSNDQKLIRKLELFVTTPPSQPSTADPEEYKNSVLAVECELELCTPVGLIRVQNLENEYSNDEIKDEDKALIENYKIMADLRAKSHALRQSRSLLSDIDIQLLCGEVQRTDNAYFFVEKNVSFNDYNVTGVKDASMPPGKNEWIFARNCLVEKKTDEYKKIFVTPSATLEPDEYDGDPSDRIIFLACQGLKYDAKVTMCHFEQSVILKNFKSYYPLMEMTFGAANYKDLAVYSAKNEPVNARILKNVNMHYYCETLRVQSRGYFVRKVNLTHDRYAVIMNQRVWNDRNRSGETGVNIRSCQLLKATDPAMEIFLTSSGHARKFAIILACPKTPGHCFLESAVQNRESKPNRDGTTRTPESINYYEVDIHEENDDDIVTGLKDGMCQSHTVLNDIDIIAFCEVLRLKFILEYTPIDKRTVHGYKVTHDKTLALGKSKPIQKIPSRSCQLRKKNGQRGVIVVTASPKSRGRKEDDACGNRTIILRCKDNSPCTFERTLFYGSFSKNYPSMSIDGIFDGTLNEEIVNDLPAPGLSTDILNRRILTDIEMDTYCQQLKALAGGLYINKPDTVEDGYFVHLYNKRKPDSNSSSNTPILSRSCQLVRVNDRRIEIHVTASPSVPAYEPVHQRVIILACLANECEVETTVIHYNLLEDYPPSQDGTLDNETAEKIFYFKDEYVPGADGAILNIGTDIRPTCKELKKFSDGKYVDNPLAAKREYDSSISPLIMVLGDSYFDFVPYTRTCQLVKMLEHDVEIRVTTAPSSVEYTPSTYKVVVLACKLDEIGICSVEDVLDVVNQNWKQPRFERYEPEVSLKQLFMSYNKHYLNSKLKGSPFK